MGKQQQIEGTKNIETKQKEQKQKELGKQEQETCYCFKKGMHEPKFKEKQHEKKKDEQKQNDPEQIMDQICVDDEAISIPVDCPSLVPNLLDANQHLILPADVINFRKLDIKFGTFGIQKKLEKKSSDLEERRELFKFGNFGLDNSQEQKQKSKQQEDTNENQIKDTNLTSDVKGVHITPITTVTLAQHDEQVEVGKKGKGEYGKKHLKQEYGKKQKKQEKVREHLKGKKKKKLSDQNRDKLQTQPLSQPQMQL